LAEPTGFDAALRGPVTIKAGGMLLWIANDIQSSRLRKGPTMYLSNAVGNNQTIKTKMGSQAQNFNLKRPLPEAGGHGILDSRNAWEEYVVWETYDMAYRLVRSHSRRLPMQ
jgi:hypothetical protein